MKPALEPLRRGLGMLFWLGSSLPGAATAYLLLLTACAGRATRRTALQSAAPTQRFAILIPAHNEEQLLPELLHSLARQEYPRELYDIHVVADNCSDATATVAGLNGALVHERHDDQLIGKGYALQWLYERVAQHDYNAFVILDADSLVSANFLQIMAAQLAQGERAIQAYYAVRDPGRSWSVALRYAALAVLHYLRPLGRSVLGGSAGLKGNGMVFAATVLRGRNWSNALTEDIEFHLQLLLDGERVAFAPDALVEAEMPATLGRSASQNIRWERGRLEMARRYVPQLLRAGITGRSPAAIDAAIEQLIPPTSTLVGASLLSMLVACLLPKPGRRARLTLALGMLGGQALYLMRGLQMVQAPRSVYLALLYAPLFLCWKLWLYLRVLLGHRPQAWVRTARNQAQAEVSHD